MSLVQLVALAQEKLRGAQQGLTKLDKLLDILKIRCSAMRVTAELGDAVADGF